MDDIPVELIGNILSKVGAARDVVIASATCRKWRQAYRQHLGTLSFNINHWPLYKNLDSSDFEILITKTVFQIKGLQCLSILSDGCHEFSASAVYAWLLYTRETLCELHFNAWTIPIVNILEICGGQKLESIRLKYGSIWAVENKFQSLPCLKSLSLCCVSVSAFNLNLLLHVCPKIESLEIIDLVFEDYDYHETVELCSPTLKSIFMDTVCFGKLIVEADCLEIVHLKGCVFEDFELNGKATLKHFKLDGVRFTHLYIGENIESLEVVEISNVTKFWPILKMISKSSSLRKLKLWYDNFDDEDEDETEHHNVDLETLAICFPKLSYLSLTYNLRGGSLHRSLQGSSCLTNLTVLNLGWGGWNVFTDAFLEWVESLLKRCPNLKRLVIHGVMSNDKIQCHSVAKFTSSMVRLMRSYMHVEVQFDST